MSTRNWLRESPLKRRLREETAKDADRRHADLGPSGPADRRCSPAPSVPGAPSRSAPSPATRRSASPRPCRPTASSGAATSARNGPRIGRRYWKEAGLESRIELTIAPALETLDWLLAQGLAGQLDLAFIDADKTNYDAYYERCLKLVRRGGLVLIDNVLWGGSVANLADKDADTEAIRALNAKLKADERVDLTLFAVGDGMTCALKR